MTEMQKLADSVFTSVKVYVSNEFSRLFEAAIAPLRKRLDELPQPMKGEPGEKGESGQNGTSVTLADIQPLIDAAVKAAVSALPAPQIMGLSGPEIEALVSAKVGEAVKEIPKPQDGRNGESVDQEVLRAMIVEEVEKIPKPENGRDADPEAITRAVAEAVAAMPKPQDGKDADAAAIQASVLEQVMRAFEAIPLPADGRDGQKGEPGRDALAIIPESAIDETRSYPRGVYAHHKGGTWFSIKTTNGMDGWQCMQNGLDTIAVVQDPEDPRRIAFGIKTTNGAVVEQEMHIPFVIDKGVFKEEQHYKAGDGVTWARHYWIATKDTSQKPDFGSDWRLAVKGGRDGSNGRDGIDKTQAVKL